MNIIPGLTEIKEPLSKSIKGVINLTIVLICVW